MKIANKISFSFLAIVIILSVTIFPIFYLVVKNSLIQRIEENLKSIAYSRTNHIKTYLKMLEISVGQLSKSVVLEDLLKVSKKDDLQQRNEFKAAIRRLKRTKEANTSVYEFLLMDKTGKVLASSNESSIGQDKYADSIFIGAQKDIYIKDVYRSEELKEPLMAVSAPLLDSVTGELLGVLAARVKLNYLYDITTESIGLGKTEEVYIVNKYGFIITPSRFLKGTFLKQRVDTENVRRGHLHKDERHLLTEGEIIDVFTDYRGISVLGTHEYIPQMQWLVLAEIETKEAFAPFVAIRSVFLILLFSMFIFAWLLGFFISKIITAPLRRLEKGAEIIGTGNLDYKIGIDTKDDVGQFARAFDTMTENLKNKTTSIENLNKEIVEHKRAQEQVQLAAEELEKKNIELAKLNQIKSTFTSMVSHELRSPLAIIKESVGLVVEGLVGNVNDEQKDLLDTAKKNVDRLGRLINNVLDFQKMESGRMEYDIQENDINAVALEVHKAMGFLAVEKGLDFVLNLQENIPKVRFDKDKIIQVFTNLVSNAAKFTEKGSISITTKKEDNMVHVIVQDTGMGIKNEDMEKLFQPFEQLSGPRDKKKGGTGLGLSICKRIIFAQNGKIWAESEEGKGSAFHFVLPIEEHRG